MANKAVSGARSPLNLVVAMALCCFFYVLGAWQRSGYGKGDRIAAAVSRQTACGDVAAGLSFETHHGGAGAINASSSLPFGADAAPPAFAPCAAALADHTPCHHQDRAMKFPRKNMVYRERHCPSDGERLRCLVPAPPGYVTPFPWPRSRDYVPFANAPYKSLTVEKAVQNWVQYEGAVFRFPGGGTQFPQGADKYIDQLGSVIPFAGGRVRTVLDTGCGVTEIREIAIWRKQLDPSAACPDRPPVRTCDDANSDDVWYKNMETCITPPAAAVAGELQPFPARLTAVPPRISAGAVPGFTAESYEEENRRWERHVAAYKKVNYRLNSERYRNIMDMNAGVGGFAAAIFSPKSWVMNVVPTAAEICTLGVVYERGLIGIYHDWCEAFSTYPRTYDLIHANGIFTLYKDRCRMEDILLEMDRILRPEGTVILRDDVEVLLKVQRTVKGMRWKTLLANHEDGPNVPEKVLFAVKRYWTAAGEGTAAEEKTPGSSSVAGMDSEE
ncbi:Methyltransferase [Zea mays]|uniref:Methyltransferase n=1 Tax=Zea mays TaxID=4577 RepID=A0A1D6F7C2_MAIZE|nr:Methyltransferase [Zea mays]